MKIRFFSLSLALVSTVLIAGCGGEPPASDLATAKGALDAARAAGAEKFAASDYSAAQGAYSGAEQAVNMEADKLFKDFGQAKQMIADAKAKAIVLKRLLKRKRVVSAVRQKVQSLLRQARFKRRAPALTVHLQGRERRAILSSCAPT